MLILCLSVCSSIRVHTSNPWNKCPKRDLMTTGGQIPIEKHYRSFSVFVKQTVHWLSFLTLWTKEGRRPFTLGYFIFSLRSSSPKPPCLRASFPKELHQCSYTGLPTWFLYQNIEKSVLTEVPKTDGGWLRICSYPYDLKVVPNARLRAQIFSKLFILVADTLNINSVNWHMQMLKHIDRF